MPLTNHRYFKPFGKYIVIVLLSVLSVFSCSEDDSTSNLKLLKVTVGSTLELYLLDPSMNTNIYTDSSILFYFNSDVGLSDFEKYVTLSENNIPVDYSSAYTSNNSKRIIELKPASKLNYNQDYYINIGKDIKGINGGEFTGLTVKFTTLNSTIGVQSIQISGKAYSPVQKPQNIDLNAPVTVTFSSPVNPGDINQSNVKLINSLGQLYSLTYSISNESTVSIQPGNPYQQLSLHTLILSNSIKGKNGESFNGLNFQFYSELDSSDKFPRISDDELLTLIQQQTFKYFWDFAHPTSGLARERNTSGDIVTTGGSGFGLMSIPVGIERGFITRTEGTERIGKIVNFLTSADRFHGAWPHWLNGSTGKVIPFSTNDDGGDLVETSYMAAGLLCVRQYLNPGNSNEQNIIDKINTLLDGIEWQWYTKDGAEDALYWHWSPNVGWAMNMPVTGYNEALITYVMAAGSATHPIDAQVYHNGWAKSGAIINGNSYYGITLPLGYSYGGPLFFAHYSFLGLNPNNLTDQYANYWQQNTNHTLINRQHCISNPKGYILYSNNCWGLTASDNQNGYSAHSPTNDLGVIAPTAAISSIPYTPEYSMQAIRFFYYTLGDRLWGEYGFYDAFNPNEGWWASSYLAIDQGPIVIMIENHRTGLCWNLFMSAPEAQNALTLLGFSYSK
ncbi:MAG: glucoamylase family protein [Bacteroidales bacterium]